MLTLSGRYDQLYTYVIFGMVLSYTLTVIGLFILRWKRPDIPRPYRCTGYPWLPAIYVLIGARVDAQHDRHTTDRSAGRGSDRADRRARIFVLEAKQPESAANFLRRFLCVSSRPFFWPLRFKISRR